VPPAGQPTTQAPQASGAQGTPASQATARPSPSPTPTPSPYLTVVPSPELRDDRLKVAASFLEYTPLPAPANVVRGSATLSVQVDAAAPTSVTLEEYDLPDNDQGDKTFDTVTVKEAASTNVRTYGADQGFTSFWVSTKEAGAGGYQVLQAEGESLAGLWIRWISGETYYISNRADRDTFVAYSAEAAARELLRTENGQPVWPQIHGASLAGMTGLYSVLREKPAGSPSMGVQALFRVGRGLPVAGTRFLPPPNIDKKTGGKLGKYALLAEDTPANPAALLLREIIAVRKELPTP
jgi:hypothetical protein